MTIGWLEDESSFRASLTALIDLLVADETLEELLERVIALARQGIRGCDLASITTMADGEFQTSVSSEPAALAIDQAQYADGSGPCVAAFRRGEAVSVPAMDAGEGWESFRHAAMARNVQSSLSLPMIAGDVHVGALNLYARRGHAFNSIPPEAALLLAKQAAGALRAAQTREHTQGVVSHLESALETRDLIGMAKGIIMTNEKLTPDSAFGLLVSASQRRNVKLHGIALEVVTTGVTPE